MERRREFAQTVLRKEEVSVLKLGLASGEFSLAEREVMVDPQMWSSRLVELELKAAMSFLPSAAKLCLGDLLLSPASNQPSYEEEAVANKVTGLGDQPGASVCRKWAQGNPSHSGLFKPHFFHRRLCTFSLQRPH